MRRIFKLCQNPELLSVNSSRKIIIYIIPHSIICHRSFYNIVIMRFSTSACSNKVQPFIWDLRELPNLQFFIRLILIVINDWFTRSSIRPSHSLLYIIRAIKSPRKISLLAWYNSIFWVPHNPNGSMVLFLIIPWNRGKNQIIYFEPVSELCSILYVSSQCTL